MKVSSFYSLRYDHFLAAGLSPLLYAQIVPSSLSHEKLTAEQISSPDIKREVKFKPLFAFLLSDDEPPCVEIFPSFSNVVSPPLHCALPVVSLDARTLDKKDSMDVASSRLTTPRCTPSFLKIYGQFLQPPTFSRFKSGSPAYILQRQQTNNFGLLVSFVE